MRHRLFEARLPGWIDPADVFAALFADERNSVWLDSSGPASGAEAPGTSYLGRGSRLVTASVADGTVTVDGVTTPGTIFDFLRSELAAIRVEPGDGFRLGWVGWLGYGLRAQTLGQPASRSGTREDAAFLFLDAAIAFDHATQTMRVLALDAASRDDLVEKLSGVRPARRTKHRLERPRVAWANDDQEYLAMIAACQDAIIEGEAYQLCLTTEVRVDIHPDPLETYLALRESSPTHHGSYFRIGDVAMLSASPEQFLAISPGGTIESKPIKGTRPRGATVERDVELANELQGNEKERAENLMIVDLMRNDIARVSAVGSVSVPSLLSVETYSHVHQLVSAVRGSLAAGLDAVDVVMACFPAGSMTGAPKRRATEILDRLEARPRGVYSGAFGYFGMDGRVDLAMVIRSIVLDERGATIGTGGGITALSVPTEELAEAKLKAAALLAVLGVE
jgi:para-aminobenzoate synthetase component 1